MMTRLSPVPCLIWKVRGLPNSVSFHANVTEYLSTILAAQSQPKTRWLMMQMTITHPERKRVRDGVRLSRLIATDCD
jgi:hypothetical protein